MSAALRAQPPLYCLQVEDDSVPVAAQERLERLAGRLWNDFYDTHTDRFFKDRHWLGREWPELAEAGGGDEGREGGCGVVEVGCGVGNAALPLLEVLAPPAPVYACDFSPTAISILRAKAASATALASSSSPSSSGCGRLRAFVADASQPGALTGDPQFPIRSGSLAAATLVFALSAMSPAAMAAAVANVKTVLSPKGGRAFVRDYAVGDMAGARLAGRSTPRRLHAWLPAASGVAAAGGGGGGTAGEEEESRDGTDAARARAEAEAEAAAALLSGGEFFARGDGTRAFYFSEGGLRRLFESAGFETESIGTVHMTKENRATRERMPRKWIQAVFRLGARTKREGTGAAAAASTRLTSTTTATTTSETTREEEEKEQEKGPPMTKRSNGVSRYRPEWQDSDDDDDDDGDDEEEETEERDANGGDKSSSSSSDGEGTSRAAARLFRTVLVDSTTSKPATAGNEDKASSCSPSLVGLEAHEADLGPPLGLVAFSAAPSELRSTLLHTGLLTWPAAPALARVLLDEGLAESFNSSCPSSSSLSLLELGSGGSPLVALAAARSRCGFRRVVSTDGSQRALRLLSSNLAANSHLVVAERLRVRLLPWGDARAAAGAVEEAAKGQRGGFDVVVGADTLYSAPALPLLMTTIAATLDRSSSSSSSSCSIAVLCYQERRVRVDAAEAAAREAGLEVVDPAPLAWAAAAERAGVGEGRLLRLLCLRPAESLTSVK